jgi:hypothetical protein
MILKTIITLSLLVSFSTVYSSEDRLSFCEKEGENFGNGQGRDVIPYECVGLFKKSAPLEAVKISPSGQIIAYGFRNIVFIKQNERMRIIAGSYTELEEIVALAIDEKNQEVAVMNKKGDVLFYSSRITGNVAPLRVLKHKDLHGASDLVINSKRNEVLILNKASRSLLFFSRMANHNAPEKLKKLNILRIVRNLVAHESVSVDAEHGELFTLNIIKNSIYVFDLDSSSSSMSPVRIMAGPVGIQDPRKVEYSASKDEIVMTNVEGKTTAIPRLPIAK